MIAVGIEIATFLVVHALFSLYVYSEARKSGSGSPAVAGGSVFGLGVGLSFVFNTVVALLVVLFYLVVLRVLERDPSPA